MDFKKLKHSSLTDQKGFSLLEVLIALTLLAMMMVFVYQMISTSTDTKDRITTDDRALLDLEFALYRIEQDVSQIYSPLFHSGLKSIDSSLYEEENQKLDYQDQQEGMFQPSEKWPMMTARGHLVPAIDSPEKETLLFLTASNRRKVQDSKQSRYAWVRYSLKSTIKSDEQKQDEEDSGIATGDYEIIRQTIAENIYTTDHAWDKVRVQTLLKSVKRLEFNFWNEDNKKWATSPAELNDKKNAMRMILVKMNYINSSGNEEEIERMFRVSWPYFDPQKDIDAVKAAKLKNDKEGGVNEDK